MAYKQDTIVEIHKGGIEIDTFSLGIATMIEVAVDGMGISGGRPVDA
jgi:hypothetical protein